MITKCAWCGENTVNLTRVEVATEAEMICPKCLSKHRAHVCITCGTKINPDSSIHGECIMCMQLKGAELDKLREDEENGVSEEAIEEATESTQSMSDQDFEEWMAKGISEYSQKAKDAFKKGLEEARKRREKAEGK